MCSSLAPGHGKDLTCHILVFYLAEWFSCEVIFYGYQGPISDG